LFTGAEIGELTAFTRATMQNGQPAHREIALSSPNGPRVIEVFLEPLRDATGAVIG